MNNYYAIKYLIGGYGSLGRVIEDSGYANTFEDYLDRFWEKYEDVLDCVKPVVLGLWVKVPMAEGMAYERKLITLTHKQQYGY